jgi:tetratricopeptide (TPR) repeat protein
MARPAVASILSGRGPDRIEVRDDVSDRLSEDAVTIAEALRGAGWRTAAFVGTPLVGYGSGLEQGFDLYDAPEDFFVGPGRFLPPSRRADEVAANARTWLAATGPGDRVFVWVHLSDLHGVTARIDEEGQQLERYDAALSEAMTALGTLVPAIEARGLAASAEIVFAGAYGAMLGEDGAYGSSYWLRDETLRTMIVWSGGRSPSGKRGVRAASTLDLAPTLIASAGANPPPEMEGVDLADEAPDSRDFQAFTWAPDDEIAWPTLSAHRQGGSWSVSPWPEAEQLPRAAVPRRRALSEETLRRLREIGVALDPLRDTGSPPLENPNEFYMRLEATRAAFADEKPVRTRRFAHGLYTTYTGNLAPMTIRLFQLSTAPGHEETNDLIRSAVSQFPLREEVLHWAGHVAFAEGDVKRAEALVLAAAEIGPADADHWYDLACARSLQGDRDEALRYLSRSIEAGYRNWGWIEQDPDLAAVRGDRRYAELLSTHGR